MKHPVSLLALVLVCLLLGGCAQAAAIDTSTPEPPAPAFFSGTILEIHDGSVLVEPLAEDALRRSADRVSVATGNLPALELQVGDRVSITYDGNIMESYPAQIRASDWILLQKASALGDLSPAQTVVHTADAFQMAFTLPAGWQYSEIDAEQSDISGAQGLRLSPQSSPELEVFVEFHTAPVGICGTGVTSQAMAFSTGCTATAHTELLGDGSFWFYLIYDAPHSGYVVSCTAPHALWQAYQAELMALLDTLALGGEA